MSVFSAIQPHIARRISKYNMQNLFNGLLLIIFVLFVLRFIKSLGKYWPVMIVALYSFAWLLLSTAYVESGVSMADTGSVSYFDFSTLRLLIYILVFFLGVYFAKRILIDRKSGRRTTAVSPSDAYASSGEITKSNIISLGLIVVAICDLILLVNIVVSGSIMTNSSINRFNFYSTYSKMSIAIYIIYFEYGISLFLGMVSAFSKSKLQKNLAVVLLAAFLGYLYLTGIQGTEILVVLLFFLIPKLIAVFSNRDISINKKQIRRIVIATALVFALIVLLKYIGLQSTLIYGAENENSFLYRLLVLQANTWWNTDTFCLNYLPFGDFSQLESEVSAFFSDTEKYDAGIWHLMQIIMPSSEYDRYLFANATLNAGYPAINVVIYGYIGAAFACFVDGAVYFCLGYYLYRKVIQQQYVSAAVFSVVFFAAYRVISMGGIWYLGTSLSKFLIFILLFVELIRKWSNTKHLHEKERKHADA